MITQCAWVVVAALCWSAGAAASPVSQQRRGDVQGKPQDSRPNDPPRPNDSGRPNDPPRGKWWLHPDSRKELGLTDQQSKKIDEIWESTAPGQREKWHELERLEDALAKTIKENTADVAVVAQQVEKVEKLRAELQINRTMMIYRMYLLLTPEQRVKVDAIRARLEEERKRRDQEQKKQGKTSEGHVDCSHLNL
jgi:Spy/CpxP family protein refolding chaperone